jgi:hypothetical protein
MMLLGKWLGSTDGVSLSVEEGGIVGIAEKAAAAASAVLESFRLVEEEEEGFILVFAGFSVVVVTATGWVECSISPVDVEHVVTSIVVVPGFGVAKRCVSDWVVSGDDLGGGLWEVVGS